MNAVEYCGYGCCAIGIVPQDYLWFITSGPPRTNYAVVSGPPQTLIL